MAIRLSPPPKIDEIPQAEPLGFPDQSLILPNFRKSLNPNTELASLRTKEMGILLYIYTYMKAVKYSRHIHYITNELLLKCKNKVEGEVVGSRLPGGTCDLPIKIYFFLGISII